MSSGVRRQVRGSFSGTGSSLDVKTIGFRPKHVELFNVTGNCRATWTESMADASMQKVVDSGSAATDISFVTSNGITPLAEGFNLGADSDLNVASEVVHYLAEE